DGPRDGRDSERARGGFPGGQFRGPQRGYGGGPSDDRRDDASERGRNRGFGPGPQFARFPDDDRRDGRGDVRRGGPRGFGPGPQFARLQGPQDFDRGREDGHRGSQRERGGFGGPQRDLAGGPG